MYEKIGKFLFTVCFCGLIAISPFSQLYVKLTFFAGLACWFLAACFRHKKSVFSRLIPATPVNGALFLFLLACGVSIIFSDNFHQAQKIFFARYIWYFAVFFIGVSIPRMGKNVLASLTAALLILSCFLGIGGIHDHLAFRPQRLFTVFGIDIPFCMLPLFLTYLIPVNFALFLFNRSRFYKAAGLINTLVLGICLFFQQSRAGWVAAPLSILALTFVKNRKWFVTSLLALCAIFAAGFFSPHIRPILETIPNPSQWNYRTPLYHSALSIFRDYPVTGAGLGMYQVLIKTDKYKLPADYPSDDKDLYLHAHNIFFELLAESGILGLMAFITIFGAFFHAVACAVKRQAKYGLDLLLGNSALVIATLLYSISGSIILVGFSHAIFFWLMFGIAVGLLNSDAPENGVR